MIAFVYSGQGAQYPGMGKELYNQFPIVQETFNQASEVLGYDLAEICFKENDKLNQTEYTQPAILTLSTAIDRLLGQELPDLEPSYLAGLSLGEYSALVRSGVFDFAEAIKFVRLRGRYMQAASPAGEGKMVAIMKTPRETIEEACRKASETAYVAPANYNTQDQIVIGGTVEGVDLALEILKEAGVRRSIPLQVSGPFHTQLLAPAAEQLEALLQPLELGKQSLPVISNTTAKPHDDEKIKETLVKQVVSSVYWEDSVRYMIDQGVDTFIEIGPGKTLEKFIKKIDKSVQAYHVEDFASLEALKEALA